jgi:deoxyribonuclease V
LTIFDWRFSIDFVCGPMDVTLQHEHAWDVSTGEAKALQKRLAPQVRAEPLPRVPQTVAGVDVSIRGDFAQAAIAVLRLPELEVVAEAVHRCDVPFPYVPGLLSFREMPALLPALRKLDATPDLFMLDSQGLAHPRRFGLACHFGVLLNVPALGVAKSRLEGERAGELSVEKGSRVALLDDDDSGETIGAVVRTRDDTNPVYVSIGHRITLDEAVEITLQCSPRYKIPEPTRAAHKLSRKERE